MLDDADIMTDKQVGQVQLLLEVEELAAPCGKGCRLVVQHDRGGWRKLVRVPLGPGRSEATAVVVRPRGGKVGAAEAAEGLPVRIRAEGRSAVLERRALTERVGHPRAWHERLEVLQQEVSTVRAARDGLDAEAESLREKLSASQVEVSGLSGDKEHLTNRLEQSEKQVGEWMEANEDMKGQITELQSDLGDLREERTLLEQDHERLIVAKKEVEESFAQRERDLKTEIDGYEDQVDALSAELKSSKETLKSLQAEHQELVTDSQEAASSLTGNIEERDEAIEKLKTSLDSGRQELARLEREAQTLREMLESERAESLSTRVGMIEKIGQARQLLQNAQHREGL